MSSPTRPTRLLRDATLIDGTGTPARRADVLVEGNDVAAVTAPGQGSDADEEMPLDGRILCPGFIDVHSHDDLALLDRPDMLPKVSQGVTTVVIGNCGVATVPMSSSLRADLGAGGRYRALLGPIERVDWELHADYFEAVEAAHPSVNVAALVGHHALRLAACGVDERQATAGEISKMAEMLDDALRAGAMGLSTGLIYPPGRAAGGDELRALGEVLAEHDRPYVSHVRDEADGLEVAVDEALAIGEEQGVRVHVSHLKAAGQSNWGKIGRVVRRLQSRSWASADVYPYVAASTSLAEALAAGGSETPTAPEDVLFAHVPGHPEVEGATLAEVATRWGQAPEAAARRLLDLPGGVSVVYFVMDEGDVQEALRFERTMIGTDGLPTLEGKPHPRLWGTFPRVLRRYALDGDLFPLEEAIRRMTSLPARTFGIEGRGRVVPGAAADLVVLDPATVRDRATYEDPHQTADGIDVVFVNGQIAYQRQGSSGARSGLVLRPVG